MCVEALLQNNGHASIIYAGLTDDINQIGVRWPTQASAATTSVFFHADASVCACCRGGAAGARCC
jgi:hypothetical protein